MATYLINKFPSRVLFGSTPYDILFSCPPSHNHLKPFGCLCYVSTSYKDRDKFQSRAQACVFIGFPPLLAKRLSKFSISKQRRSLCLEMLLFSMNTFFPILTFMMISYSSLCPFLSHFQTILISPQIIFQLPHLQSLTYSYLLTLIMMRKTIMLPHIINLLPL